MKFDVYIFFGFLILSGITESAIAEITSVSVTPTFAKSGTIFKFTANLDAPLTTGNKVKIDLGKGLASMTGKGINYSLSRAIYTEGKQTYNVGIYNAKNVLQGKISSGNYNIESVTPVSKPKLPTIDVINAFKKNDYYVGFAITLSAPLPSTTDYRVKIEADDKQLNDTLSYYADFDFKNGKNDSMMNDGKDFYQEGYLGGGVNSVSSGIYSVGIYDAKGNLVSNKRSGNFKATAPKDNKAPTLEFSVPNNVIFNKNFTAKLASKDPNGDVFSVEVLCGSGRAFHKNITSINNQLNLNCMYTDSLNIGLPSTASVTAYDSFSSKSELSSRIFLRSNEPKKINVSNKSYTKISNDGAELPQTANLGSKPNDWGCTRDNETGFVWEIKTDDDSFRSRYNVITEHSVKYAGNKCNNSSCDTDSESYTKTMNDAGICGIKSWKMPTLEQLNTLVYCSDGEYNPLDILISNSSPDISYICSSSVTYKKNPLYTKSTAFMMSPYIHFINIIVNTPTIDTVYFPDVEKGIERFMSSTRDYSHHNESILATNFGDSNNYGDYSGGKGSHLRLMGCQKGWHLDESNNVVTDVFLGLVSSTQNKCVKDN